MSVKNLVNRIQELSDKTVEELSKELGKDHVKADESHMSGYGPWTSYYIYNDDGNVVGVFGFETSLKLASGDFAILGYWDVADDVKDFLYTKDYSSIHLYYYEKYNAETNTVVDSSNVIRPKTTKSLTTFVKDMKKVFNKIVPENHDVLLNEDLKTFNTKKECLDEFNSLVTSYTDTILDILGPNTETTTVVDTIDCKLTKCIHKESGIAVGIRVDKGSVFTVNFEKGRDRLIFRLVRSDNTLHVTKDAGFTFMKFLDFDTWCKELTNEVGSNVEVFLEAVLNEDEDIYIEYDSNEEATNALNELKATTEAKLNQVIPADMKKQTKEEGTGAWEIALTTYEKDDFKLTVASAYDPFANTAIYQLHFNTLDNTRIIFSTCVHNNYLDKQLDFSGVESPEKMVAVAELDTFIAKLKETIEEVESNNDIFLEGNLMEGFQYYKGFDSEIQATQHFEQLTEDYYNKVIKTLSERGLEFEVVDKEYNSIGSGSIKVININSIEFSINVHRINFGPTHVFSMTYRNSYNNLVFITVDQQYDDVWITNKGAKTEICCPTIESFIETLNKDLDTMANNNDVLLEEIIDTSNTLKEDFVYFHGNDFNEAKEYYDQLVEEWDAKLEDVINKYNGKKVTSLEQAQSGISLTTTSIYFEEFPDFEVTLSKLTFPVWFAFDSVYSIWFKDPTEDEKSIRFKVELTRQGDILVCEEDAQDKIRCKTFDEWLNLLCQTMGVLSPSTDTFLEDYVIEDADKRVVRRYNEVKAGLSETLEKNDLFIKDVEVKDVNKQIGTIRRIPLVVKEHLQYNVNDIKLNIALVQSDDPDDLDLYTIAMASFMNDEEGVRHQVAILGENCRSNIVHLRSNDPNAKNVESFDVLIENFIKYVKSASNNSDVILESVPLKENVISLPIEVHNAYEDVTKIAKDIADLIQKYTKITPVVETGEFADADSSVYQKIEYTFNARYYSLNDNDKIVPREHAGTVFVSTLLGSIGPTQNWMGINILYLPWVGETKNAALSTEMIEDITGPTTIKDMYPDGEEENGHLSVDALLDEIITSFGHVETVDTFL